MVLHGIALHLMILHSPSCHCIVSYGVAWYCIVGFGARAVSRKTPTYFIEMFDFHMQNHIMGSRTLLLFYVKWSTNDTGSYYFAFYSLK